MRLPLSHVGALKLVEGLLGTIVLIFQRLNLPVQGVGLLAFGSPRRALPEPCPTACWRSWGGFWEICVGTVGHSCDACACQLL